MTTGGDDIDRAYFADGTPDLSEHSPAYGVETIAQALLNIYREVVDVEGGIEPNLYQETRRIFSEAVADGWVKASDRDIPTPNQAFRDAFLHSADVFSAFRVHRMQQDIAAQMIDSNGNVKPFRKFVKDVSPYIEHRNREWLQTEYNTAILRAQNAAEWQQFMAEKDVFPNLEWIPSTSPNPGEDHRVFWGTVRPVDDPFWNVHKPGDRWNCKCELRQTEKDVTPVPTGKPIDNAAKGLESNPAKDKEVFSDKHPYYPKNCSVCPFAGNKLMALVHDLASGKDCHHCRRINKSIATTEKKAEAVTTAAKKALYMTVIRAHELAQKRPGGLRTVKSMKSGKMLDSKKSFMTLYNHEKTIDELQAVVSFFTKPSKVRFVRVSPLGEGKDLSNPKDVLNIAKKRGRNVSQYNVYEFKTSNGIYVLKTEVRVKKNKEFEIPYFLRKKE